MVWYSNFARRYVDLRMANNYYHYTDASFDDLDLDARSQWLGRGKQTQRLITSTTKQAISMVG